MGPLSITTFSSALASVLKKNFFRLVLWRRAIPHTDVLYWVYRPRVFIIKKEHKNSLQTYDCRGQKNAWKGSFALPCFHAYTHHMHQGDMKHWCQEEEVKWKRRVFFFFLMNTTVTLQQSVWSNMYSPVVPQPSISLLIFILQCQCLTPLLLFIFVWGE